uniref:FUN14 domain-containing protein 2 n=1 Tax=Schistocephalus solidus TaxID=70667 RepID=A0A0X3PRN4_SCHSO
MIENLSRAEDEVASFAKGTLSEIEKRPKMQQIVIGAASGIATGYIFAKIGKSIALLVGVSIIGLQFVGGPKRFSINWRQVENDARSILQQKSTLNLFRENQIFFGSFGGGFLVGMSFF